MLCLVSFFCSLNPFRERFEFKFSETDYSHISTHEEIKTLFQVYGIETTNEIFRALQIKDDTCSEETHLHGVLDGRKLGVACVPSCDGKIVGAPRDDGNGLEYKCYSSRETSSNH